MTSEDDNKISRQSKVALCEEGYVDMNAKTCYAAQVHIWACTCSTSSVPKEEELGGSAVAIATQRSGGGIGGVLFKC